jgi:hypothetical protein
MSARCFGQFMEWLHKPSWLRLDTDIVFNITLHKRVHSSYSRRSGKVMASLSRGVYIPLESLM